MNIVYWDWFSKPKELMKRYQVGLWIILVCSLAALITLIATTKNEQDFTFTGLLVIVSILTSIVVPIAS